MSIHGFEILRREELVEYRAVASLCRHLGTGAELMSVEAADENKVFGVTFRTPPADHTGVAHILEHAVLCGSRKYPCKEPFVELLKGSLQTFLNAFTYPDKTCYPVASQNLRDFYNLIDVYLDAVFYPLLARTTFEQEGWHYELEAPDKPLAFKGVVFNEMKGVYSSPDSVLIEQAQHSLFPDTVYGLDSGGDPAHIPDLSYEQLLAFHRRYYHPSNSRIFFYGDDDPERRLALMNEWLSAFDRRTPDSSIPEQAAFDAPRTLTRHYRANADGPAKSFVALNWVLPSPTDAAAALHAQALAHILIGTPASPLRKAMLESGLGEDIAGCGLETHARQMFFSTGLRGVSASNAERVPPLARQTLETLARDGIDPKTIEAALNTVEFALRENNTGAYPRGLALMLRALTSWNYDGDPFAPLRFAEPMAAVRERVAAGEPFFESLIRKWLLDNPHHTVLSLHPDPELGARLDAAERHRLEAARAAMSEAELQAIAAHTAELIALQSAPDDPEALAKIPRLSVADLPRENKPIPTRKQPLAKTRVLYHDLFTNGILYLDIAFDLRELPSETLPYVPLFGRALLETGAGSEDYVALNQRIGSKTGGIVARTFSSMVRETESGTIWLVLRAKALEGRTADLLRILYDVLTGARIDRQSRIRQIALEEKAGVESNLVPSGHHYVGLRMRAGFDEAAYAAEEMGGISYLFFLRKLIREIDTHWDGVAARLASIMDALVNRRAMVVNATIDSAAWERIAPQLESFLGDLPDRAGRRSGWTLPAPQAREGLAVPAAVNYVGRAYRLRSIGHVFRGSDLVATRYLRSAYLWEKIRVQGGAYGAFCSLDHRSGVISFTSYRDPNLQATLDVYAAAADYLATIDLDRSELEKAIIGAIGDLDQHMLPDAKGYAALCRWLANDPDPFRQEMREQMLAATARDFRRFGEALRAARAHERIAVLGNAESLSALPSAAITRVL
jgi:Zn-dependent M16 (insulinase) family peptidase